MIVIFLREHDSHHNENCHGNVVSIWNKKYCSEGCPSQLRGHVVILTILI